MPTQSHPLRLETQVVHAGNTREFLGSAVLPIFQSTVFDGRGGGRLRYPRMGNLPNQLALGELLAALEGAEAGLVATSGMAAISAALLAVTAPGTHVLAQRCVYGTAFALLSEDLHALGVEVEWLDGRDPDAWKRALRRETVAIYLETLSNPLLEVGELDVLAAFATEHGLVSMIDNTLASPIHFRPAEQGFDLSLQSATKVLNGHSDVIAGAVTGRAEWVEKVRAKLGRFGGCLDAHACFLLQRGIKTLALRMERQSRSALEFARFLEGRSEVRVVHYPGLEQHPDHERAMRLLDGFGGVLSFEFEGTAEAAQAFMERTTLPALAPSMGGVETLITRPAETSHGMLTPDARAHAGIVDELVRVSVGIEAIEDLIEDFARAFEGGCARLERAV